MTKRTTIGLAAAVLVLAAGLGTGVGFVTAQGQGAKPTPTTTPEPKDKQSPTPSIESKEASAERRKRLAMLLEQVDAELEKQKKAAQVEGDPAALRAHLQALETRLSELLTRVRTERLNVPPELAEAMDSAQQRLDAAKKAAVPADYLSEAAQSHPKVVEAQAKLKAKEDELRASKLPKDDAGRKKLDEERVVLFKDLQAVQKLVVTEVESYLRAPGVVEAKKAVAASEARVRQIEMKAVASRDEYELVAKEVANLREQLKSVEPAAEEMAWLKEKRKRLKQELLELELKELGIGK